MERPSEQNNAQNLAKEIGEALNHPFNEKALLKLQNEYAQAVAGASPDDVRKLEATIQKDLENISPALLPSVTLSPTGFVAQERLSSGTTRELLITNSSRPVISETGRGDVSSQKKDAPEIRNDTVGAMLKGLHDEVSHDPSASTFEGGGGAPKHYGEN